MKVILATGCFDIVHVGHIEFLQAASKKGDLLFVGLENDETVRINKGANRPFNKLKHRLFLLSELQSVDYVFGFEDTPHYKSKKPEIFILRNRQLAPSAIAVSKSDEYLKQKQIQAKQAGTIVVKINNARGDSSTRLLKLMGF